jgi:hypothetical protein
MFQKAFGNAGFYQGPQLISVLTVKLSAANGMSRLSKHHFIPYLNRLNN